MKRIGARAWSYMSSGLTKARGLLMASLGMSIATLLSFSVAATAATFSDVPDSHWANAYIQSVYDSGIADACGSDPLRFCPSMAVKKGEMAAFIVRAKEGNPAAGYCGTEAPFIDVPANSAYCGHVKRLKELGIAKGCGGTTSFCTASVVTRAEMAALVVRAVEGEPPAGYCKSGAPFSDVSVNHWSCGYIKRLAELKLTTGCGNGKYCPGNSVTRDQMAAFLSLAFLQSAAEYALPADRQTIWNPGLNAVGGIPTRTTIFTTLQPSGGDDTAAIQAALDNCPADQVVQLSSGTFHISGEGLTIRNSNITLRGEGAGVTYLVQASGAQFPVIIIGERWYKWFQQTAFTSDAAKGGNSVTLANNPGLEVGELVHVNETYDPSLIYFNPDTQNGDYQGWGEGRVGPQAESRPIGQAMEIASIDGNTVTFTTPFHIAFRVSHGAHLARISNGAVLEPATKWSGIESLSVASGSGGDGGGNIRVFAAMYSWAKNIESSQAGGAAFAFDGTFRCELRDSYLHSTSNPNPGGGGYGIVVDSYAADNLIENNISWNFNKVISMRSSGGGNVVGYNYFEDGYGAGYPMIVEVGLNGSHMAGSHYELFEGNQAFNFDSDSFWGTQIYFTVFRNHLTTLRRSLPGVQTPLTEEMNRRGIGLTVNQWWHSFVGNVIGYPDGYLQNPAIGHPYPATFSPQVQADTFTYEWLGGPFDKTRIWQLGYDGSHWYETQDAQVQARTLRDANFDYFTKSVRWHGIGGTGTGTTPASPPTLPASLYLKAKPAFFGSSPWPWVDGSSASSPLPGALPARTRFDAGRPND